MHRDRLERLAILLENYRESSGPRFDLGSWGTSELRRGGFLWLRKHTCNTAACAVGLACISGVFRSDGLLHAYDDLGLYPIFDGASEWDAVRDFFDLTIRQGFRLFDKDEYRVWYGEEGARAVARRIRSMIAPRKRASKKPKTDISPLTALLDPANHDSSVIAPRVNTESSRLNQP